jgi:hypothetical protein
MVERRSEVLPVVGVLAFAATIHADMMPRSRLDSGYRQPLAVCDEVVLQHTGLFDPFGWPGVVDLDSLPVGPIPASNDDEGQTCETKPVQILADGQSSCSLCLYALFGLGLYRSAPCVRRLSFGSIPEWYHSGGPCGIGHSHAVGPDLCLAPVVCFIQPGCTAEDSPAKYCRGTVVSPWRESQFISSLFASRGPPMRPDKQQLTWPVCSQKRNRNMG